VLATEFQYYAAPTLRGHFPVESEPVKGLLEIESDASILAPVFAQGGRYTINDVQYVARAKHLNTRERDTVCEGCYIWLQEQASCGLDVERARELSRTVVSEN